jgi:hypothetical protein
MVHELLVEDGLDGIWLIAGHHPVDLAPASITHAGDDLPRCGSPGPGSQDSNDPQTNDYDGVVKLHNSLEMNDSGLFKCGPGVPAELRFDGSRYCPIRGGTWHSGRKFFRYPILPRELCKLVFRRFHPSK